MFFKKMSVLAMCLAISVAGFAYSPRSEAQGLPHGGYFFGSFCGYYGPAAALCPFGPGVVWFGPFTSQAQCISALSTMQASGSIFSTPPRSLSTCFYSA